MRVVSIFRRKYLLSFGLILFLCVFGLWVAATTHSRPSQSPDEAAEDPVASAGPWWSLVQDSIEMAVTEEERSALEDGVIQDSEYAYFQGRIINCLGNLGIEASFKADKSLSYANAGNVSKEQIAKCMSENGLNVIALKDAMDRNPQNLDESEILVSCLQRAEIIERDYTADDLRRGVDVNSIMKNPLFMECNENPLGFLLE